MICGKIKPTSGQITFEGKALINLEVGYSKATAVLSYALNFGRSADRERLEKLAEFVVLKDCLDTPVRHLSHGHTQWLVISHLLAQDPELILMDEPTAGMTTHETGQTVELFNRLKGKHTLIVVEHDMGFVKEIGEVISVMHQGKLLAEGMDSEIERNPEVRAVYLGSSGIARA